MPINWVSVVVLYPAIQAVQETTEVKAGTSSGIAGDIAREVRYSDLPTSPVISFHHFTCSPTHFGIMASHLPPLMIGEHVCTFV